MTPPTRVSAWHSTTTGTLIVTKHVFCFFSFVWLMTRMHTEHRNGNVVKKIAQPVWPAIMPIDIQQNSSSSRSRTHDYYHHRPSVALHANYNNNVTFESRRLSTSERNTREYDFLVKYLDSIYIKGDWDGAPIIMEEYKLVFFTVAKVGCTVWKQLFRRMMSYENWNVEEYDTMLPWNPETNGLKYLYDYDRETASKMMSDPTWTRAIFVRDPKERFVSAYLDKVIHHETYLVEKCCYYYKDCLEPARRSITNFLSIIHFCDDAHWRPFAKRIREDYYWQYLNYVGNMERVQEDAEKLLRQIGAWDTYGATGWGVDGTEAIFESKSTVRHSTDAKEELRQFISPELEVALDEYYGDDYRIPILNISYLEINPSPLR